MSSRKNSTSQDENYRASTSEAMKQLNAEVRKSHNGNYEINPGVLNRIVAIYIDNPLDLESPQPSPSLGNASWSLPPALKGSDRLKKEVRWVAKTAQEKEEALRLVGKKMDNLKKFISPSKIENFKPCMFKPNQIKKPPKTKFIKTSIRP